MLNDPADMEARDRYRRLAIQIRNKRGISSEQLHAALQLQIACDDPDVSLSRLAKLASAARSPLGDFPY